jgi:hypothetical protein
MSEIRKAFGAIWSTRRWWERTLLVVATLALAGPDRKSVV